MQQMWIQSLGWEDPLEKVMAAHSSIVAMDRGAWRAAVHGVTRVRHDLVTKQQLAEEQLKSWEIILKVWEIKFKLMLLIQGICSMYNLNFSGHRDELKFMYE